MRLSRREGLKFLTSSVLAGSLIASKASSNVSGAKQRNKISLSQWCYHRAIFGEGRDDYPKFISLLASQPDEVLLGPMDTRDITKVARDHGIESIDLVNLCFYGHAQDTAWLNDFKQRADDTGTRFQLLMCDETGFIGASSKRERKQSIELHLPWLEAAAHLGCQQLRVNAYGDGSYYAQLEQCAETLDKLADIGQSMGIEILVENHGHPSSNAAWLAMLMQKTGHSNLGVLTDLDNFFMGGWNIEPERRYDRVQGLLDLAAYTRGVSVKSYDFDAEGEETKIDFKQCFEIIQAAGFDGYYSVEYEGEHLSEHDGTVATIALTKTVLNSM
jgi:sugar phosphate isomerase/epimerase